MEYYFKCPYCWQEISFLLDTSINEQKYIEDCEVCCNPIGVSYEVLDGEIAFFDAQKIQ